MHCTAILLGLGLGASSFDCLVEYLMVRRVVAEIVIEVIDLGRGVVVLSNLDSIGFDRVVVVVEAKGSTLTNQQRVG